jgi:hypothetical protein
MTVSLSLSDSNFIKKRLTWHVKHGDWEVSGPLLTIVRGL